MEPPRLGQRPAIDLDRQRGEFVEIPGGPLYRARTLHIGLAAAAVLMAIALYADTRFGGSWVIAAAGMVAAVMFGVCLAGRFPAYWFRKGRK
jgi:hypothetical protein